MLQEDITEHFSVRPLDKLREERMWLASVPQDFELVMWDSRAKAVEGLTPHQIQGLVPAHYAFEHNVQGGVRATSRTQTGEFVSWSLQGLLEFLGLDVRLFVTRGNAFRLHPPGSWTIRRSTIVKAGDSFVFAVTVLQDARVEVLRDQISNLKKKMSQEKKRLSKK